MRTDSTPETSAPVAPPAPDLPEALQEGGPVDSELRSVPQSPLSTAALAVHRRLSAELVWLRSHYTDEARSPESLWSFLAGNYEHCWHLDFVLRYVLLCQVGIEPDEFTRKWAQEAYARTPDAYDEVLGDLLDEEFRKEARVQVERQAYVDGVNASAALDWPVYEHDLDVRRDRPAGLATGLPRLDGALGGLRGLTVLAGDPGVGTTSLALWMATAALENHEDVAVLLYSLDLPKTIMFDRLVCQKARTDARHLLSRCPTHEQRLKLADAHDVLGNGILVRLRVIDREGLPPQHALTAALFRRHAQELLRSSRARLVLTVIDHFGLIGVPDMTRSEGEGNRYRVDLLRQLRESLFVSGEPLGAPFLVTSPLRDPGYGRTELTLADLGNADLAYAADSVLLLGRLPESSGAPAAVTPLTIQVAKGRDGTVDGPITLTFHEGTCQFADWERANDLAPLVVVDDRDQTPTDDACEEEGEEEEDDEERLPDEC